MNIARERFTADPAAPAQDRSIGAILMDSGRITLADAERIMLLQKEGGLRFGDAAIKLGLITTADIQHALARQYDYPYLLPGDDSVSPELVAAFAPFGAEVEGYRALRSQLMLRWFGANPERRALAVVSPGRGEGRSHLAANLAIVFSQLGERTLLVDADMRHPRQHELFKLPNRVGLSSILSGRADMDAVQRIRSFIDLSVLTAGGAPPNPQELLGRPAFANLLEHLCGDYDVVIVDTSAGAESADSQTVAVRASAALLIARRHRTPARELNDLALRLSSASARVVGTVLAEF